MIERMWINQPGENQPLHKMHGRNVLADQSHASSGHKHRTIYFLDGPVTSMRIHSLALAPGWLNVDHTQGSAYEQMKGTV